VLQGSALSLRCGAVSAPAAGCEALDRPAETTATWYFSGGRDGDGAAPVRPRDEDPASEYVQSRHGELVLLSADTRHSGTYTCRLDRQTVAAHHVRVLRTQAYVRSFDLAVFLFIAFV